MRSLDLRIDELALTGVPAHQREAVLTAFRVELARALAAAPGGLVTAPADRIDVGRAHAGGAALGAAAGRALGEGLSG